MRTFVTTPRAGLPALAAAAIALVLLLSPFDRRALADGGGAPAGGPPPVKLTGLYVEFCSCERICESILLEPNHRGTCASVCALKVEAGQRGEVSLAGVTVAIVAPDPGGNIAGKAGAAPVLYVDRAASATQVEAIRALLAERFAMRYGLTPTTPARAAKVTIGKSSEEVTLNVDGVGDLRGRPITNGYRRMVQIENPPNAVGGYPNLARGIAGQFADPTAHVTINAEGKSVLFGKFDFGAPRGKKS